MPGAAPDVVGVGDDLGARGRVLVVGDRGVGARRRSRRARCTPWATSSWTPSGVIATRCSPSLTSRAGLADDGHGSRPLLARLLGVGARSRLRADELLDASVRQRAQGRLDLVELGRRPRSSGGDSCTTGSPRSSARQIRPPRRAAARGSRAASPRPAPWRSAPRSPGRPRARARGSSRRRGRRRRSGCRAGPRSGSRKLGLVGLRTCSRMSSSSNSSRLRMPTAQLTGWPPKVMPCRKLAVSCEERLGEVVATDHRAERRVPARQSLGAR